MAAPITHIVLADKVFNKYFTGKDKKDFFIGTIFPDIRYLGEIRRSETHFEDVTFPEVKKENSFFAGFKFHSLVDKARQRFVREQNLYSFLPISKFTSQMVKLIEDKLLYSKLKDWQETENYLSSFCKEEFSFKVSRAGVKKWHRLLKNYFSKQPGIGKIVDFLSQLESFRDNMKEIEILLRKLDGNSKITEASLEFYENFEKLLEKKS